MSLKVVSILLKIIEIAALVAGTGVVGYFMKELRKQDFPMQKNDDEIDEYDEGHFGRYEFYLYSTSLGVIIAILSLVALIAGQLEQNGGTLGMAIAGHALCTVQLLVSTALLTIILATYKKELEWVVTGTTFKISFCDGADMLDRNYHCNQLIGGVACGFTGAVLFLVDTIVHAISWKRSSA